MTVALLTFPWHTLWSIKSESINTSAVLVAGTVDFKLSFAARVTDLSGFTFT
jgi:hypothetical protein